MEADREYPTGDGKLPLLTKQQRVALERNLKSIYTERKQWLRQHDVQINNFKRMHKRFLPKVDIQQGLKMNSSEHLDKHRESNIPINNLNDDLGSQQFKTLNHHHCAHRLCLGERSNSHRRTDFNFLQTLKHSESLLHLSTGSALARKGIPLARSKSEPLDVSTSPGCDQEYSRRSSVNLPPISSIRPFLDTFRGGSSTGNENMNRYSQVLTSTQSLDEGDVESPSSDYTPNKKNNEMTANFETGRYNFRRNSLWENNISDERSSKPEEAIKDHVGLQKTDTFLGGSSTGNENMNRYSQVLTSTQSLDEGDLESPSSDYTPNKKNNEMTANFETGRYNFRRNSLWENNISDERSSKPEEAIKDHVGLQKTCSSADKDCELNKTGKWVEKRQSTTSLIAQDHKHAYEKNVGITEATDVLNLLDINSTHTDKTSEHAIALTKAHTLTKGEDELNEYEDGEESHEEEESSQKNDINTDYIQSKSTMTRPLHRLQLKLNTKACDTDSDAAIKKNSIFETCLLCPDPMSNRDIILDREIYHRQSTKTENKKENRKRSVKNMSKTSPSEIKDYEIKTLKTLLKFSKGPKKVELMTRLMSIYKVNDIPTLKDSWRDSLLECNYLRTESDNTIYD